MSNYKFDFYAWGKAIMQRKNAREQQIANAVATKLTRQIIKDAIQLAIKTNNFENIPDDISNSDISNDSEIHYDIHDEKQYDIHGHNMLYNELNYTYPIYTYPIYTYMNHAKPFHMETVPNETVPNETVPNETVPNETVPNETVHKKTKPVRKKSWFFCCYKKQLKNS